MSIFRRNVSRSGRACAAIVFACFLKGAAHAAPTTYILTPLYPTTVNNGVFSFGYGVNDVGQVAGDSSVSVGKRGTLWDGSTTSTYLPNPNGLASGGLSHGFAINNNGWVVGQSTGASSVQGGVWKPGSYDTPIQIASPAGAAVTSSVWGINDSNVAAGKAGYSGLNGTFRAINWSETVGLTQLPSPAGTNNTEAHDVNNSGVTVGQGNGSGFTGVKGLRWESSTSTPIVLESLANGGGTTTAWAVNSNGIAVGWGSTATGGSRPLMWDANGAVTILAETGAFPFDINDSNVVVGNRGDSGGKLNQSGQGSRRGFVYSAADGFLLLESLIDPSTPDRAGWTALVEANSINNRGQITGFGTYNGVSIAFLATPVPEPIAIGSAMAFALALVRRRRIIHD